MAHAEERVHLAEDLRPSAVGIVGDGGGGRTGVRGPDIAGNGAFDSAPAIVSILFPAHETRRYEPGPDGTPRIASIDHADPAKAQVYADPMLMARADWRDDYAWGPDGRLAGWQRSRPGQPPERFDAAGRRLDPAGPRSVTYPLHRTEAGALAVTERPAP